MLSGYALMEKMSLKNIKVILIAIIILFILVSIFKAQTTALSNASKTKESAVENTNNRIPEEYTIPNEEIQKENNSVDEELEVDTDPNEPQAQNKEVSEGANLTEDFNPELFKEKEASKGPKTQEDKNADKLLSQDILETKKEQQVQKTTIQQVKKDKTPQEVFDFALSEMEKGRYNSAIYEFNNAIDKATTEEMSLAARKYLAQCYEKKGINTEAFDMYEYIYLHTNNKDDLLEMNRVAHKTTREHTAHNYIQKYIDEHPEEKDNLSRYINY